MSIEEQAQNYVTLKEYFGERLKDMEKEIRDNRKDIQILLESKALLQGKASQLYVTVTFLISILALVVSLYKAYRGTP